MQRTAPVMFRDLLQFPYLSSLCGHSIDDKDRVITEDQIEEVESDHGTKRHVSPADTISHHLGYRQPHPVIGQDGVAHTKDKDLHLFSLSAVDFSYQSTFMIPDFHF